MVTDFISIAVVALVAALSPLLASVIPNKMIPETVFLIIAGALLGPYMANIIVVSDPMGLLSDLGLVFLFLLAGYEINPKNLTGTEGKRGFATWLISLGLAFLTVLVIPDLHNNATEVIAIAIALATTTLGTLLPILKERNLMNTRIGDAVLSYGTYGELGPIIAMALLLSTHTEWQTALILIAFTALAVFTAVFSSRARKAGSRLFTFLDKYADTTSQTIVRFTVLLLVTLTAVSAIFDLDIILGAFAAGFILRYIIPEGNFDLETKLDGIAYGFLIPIFFVVSGAKINLMAVVQKPLILIGFVVLMLLIRAVPIFISLTRGKNTRTISRSGRLTISLYCTTALPVIVAVTAIAVQAEAMSQDIASILVSAGAITVLLMPLLASLTQRVSGEMDETEAKPD